MERMEITDVIAPDVSIADGVVPIEDEVVPIEDGAVAMDVIVPSPASSCNEFAESDVSRTIADAVEVKCLVIVELQNTESKFSENLLSENLITNEDSVSISNGYNDAIPDRIDLPAENQPESDLDASSNELRTELLTSSNVEAVRSDVSLSASSSGSSVLVPGLALSVDMEAIAEPLLASSPLVLKAQSK